MNSENHENDIYGLIGKLSESLLQQFKSDDDNPYLPQIDRTKHLKYFKSKAYEILLKKSANNCTSIKEKDNDDPIQELLKHAFVLKVGKGCVNQGKQLERLLDELIADGLQEDSVSSSVLQFLNCLKSLDEEDQNTLNIFHYGEKNPHLPEMLYDNDGVPPFQIYPIESFSLPDKFEYSLRYRNKHDNYNASEIGNNLSLLGKFITNASNSDDNKTKSHYRAISNSELNICQRNSELSSTFFPQIKSRLDSQSHNKEGIVTEPESPWQTQNPIEFFKENTLNIQEIQSETHLDISNADEHYQKIIDGIDSRSSSKSKTWEELGSSAVFKELPFISETNEATVHLSQYLQEKYFPSLEQTEEQITIETTAISFEELLENIKFLLLGFESTIFCYDPMNGFELRKRILVTGVSSETLENLSFQLTRWGTCYKNLSNLAFPSSSFKTEQHKANGIIFKALCKSIKEFLLFYRASVLTLLAVNKNTNLINFLKKIEPLGNLVIKVSELCLCNSQTVTNLGEGFGILTHIYDAVTKVTEPDVALCFYSILKDCCEVYFRLLQQWLFEGTCSDIHGEFMIKIRSQYLQTCGYRFWTRAFSVNEKCMPGFLANLQDIILQCGKAIRLLRLCDPENPLCQISITYQPQVKVCLSSETLKEQAKFFEKYMLVGEEESGVIVSLASAIEEEKETERKRAELVINAQKNTLERLKREQQNVKLQLIEEKNKLFEDWKEQVKESVLRKEKKKNEELLAEKAYLEAMLKQEEETKLAEIKEKEKSIQFYQELAKEAKLRKARANWRMERMKLFDNRVNLIAGYSKEYSNTESVESHLVGSTSEERCSTNKIKDAVTHEANKIQEELQKEKGHILIVENLDDRVSQDFNSNSGIINTKDQNNQHTDVSCVIDKENRDTECIEIIDSCIKPKRPTKLSISGISDENSEERSVQQQKNKMIKQNLEENLIAAKQNKLKILHQEFGITTPNNNKSIFMDLESISSDSPERQRNRLKNMQQQFDFNWDISTTKDISDIQNLLTEAQINRNKVMSHTYNLPLELTDSTITQTKLDGDLTDLQKNRNRNMAHNTQYNYEKENETRDIIKNQLPEFSREELQSRLSFKETPMSTATDNFNTSVISNTMPVQSSENTPFSESTNPSDMLFVRSYDGMSTDDLSRSHSQLSRGFQEVAAFPDFIGLESPDINPSLNTKLTVADVEMIDITLLKVFLEKSVIIPLRVQSILVNRALIKYLVREHKLLLHLHSIRTYFFLLNGEFARVLMENLFRRLYQVSHLQELLNSATLANILKKSLIYSMNSSHTTMDYLTLTSASVPNYLKTSNPEVLSCISLNYKVDWPLNIIFNDSIMDKYNRVFKFLLMVGRVQWVLQEDFHILKAARKVSYSKKQHKLQLYRHSMVQFMNALHTYLTCSVLHASWSEFEKILGNAKTFDDLYDTHVIYIKKILSKCMLDAAGEKMKTALCNIFTIVLKFHNRIKCQNWTTQTSDKSVGPDYEILEKLYNGFCEQRAYLSYLVEKITNKSYQPHLMQFLHGLNINHRYSITLKKSSNSKPDI